ncbi:hypothetical protein [Cellulomonas sp. KRMCY2]|uniref:hypothetical protein n=1 Tax=Cellulomonas sp. KRMCY2 TaxID=1304865 RepID=UPI00045EB564|nr:hypothetical protein [Cellulomonas sp. KRMCY2]
MTEDEQFAERLRTRVDPLTPTIEVDHSNVLARGRRRRTARRALGLTAAVGVVAAAGTGVAVFGIPGWAGDVAPAVDGSGEPSIASTPTPGSTVEAPLPPPVAPYGAADFAVSADGTVTGVSGDPWEGDGLYWYTADELRDTSGNVLESHEDWQSRERPGLGMSDADTAGAWSKGPAAILGTFVVAGVELDLLAEPAYLPTDPTALDQVVRASIALDQRNGAGRGPTDQRAFQRVTELLMWNSGTLPQDLRDALWQVAVAVPGAESWVGTDPDGRAAEIVHFTYQPGDGPDIEIYRDPGTGLVIATHYLSDGTSIETWDVVTEQGPISAIPLQPTLELAGCATWITC